MLTREAGAGVRSRKHWRRRHRTLGHLHPKRVEDSFRPMPKQGPIFAPAYHCRGETIRIGVNDRYPEALENDHVCAIEVCGEVHLNEVLRGSDSQACRLKGPYAPLPGVEVQAHYRCAGPSRTESTETGEEASTSAGRRRCARRVWCCRWASP